MDQVVVVKAEVTKPHAQALEAKAREANMSMPAYIQRLLQHAANPQMGKVNTVGRQLAALTASTMHVARELRTARRAYSSCDGRDPKLAAQLASASSSASTVLDAIATTQRQIA